MVALPSEGSAGTGLEGDPDAMAQLVWTLTAVDRLTNVSLERDGKRLSSVRADNSQSVMGFCASMPGPYHLQGKIEAGSGDYRMGVYIK